ncbi:cell adhesion molecule CEACAM1-like [Pyxicephalus adspersus]|uniref:cell adhesion molecule CEACAM1-like n=1 Tax=Pyxicephalus adspersus TaxID=30357 RepID=UPI003B5AB7C9
MFTTSNLDVTITNLTLEDSETYCCTVETLNNREKKEIRLQVIQPTTCEYNDGQNNIVQAHNTKAIVGQSVTLTCGTPDQGTFALSWTVFSRNESLPSSQHYKDRVKFTNRNLDVTITDLTLEDSGTFCCALRTPTNQEKKMVMLEVEVMQLTCEDESKISYILYSVIVLQTFIIIAIFVLGFRRPFAAYASGVKNEANEQFDTGDLQYAEIYRTNNNPHPGVRQTGERVTYSAIRCSGK